MTSMCAAVPPRALCHNPWEAQRGFEVLWCEVVSCTQRLRDVDSCVFSLHHDTTQKTLKILVWKENGVSCLW